MRRARSVAALLFAMACSRPEAKKDVEAPPEPVRSVATEPATTASAPPSKARLIVEAAPADGDAASLIRTKRLEATNAGRVLVVYVGATWCEPCKRLKAEIASGRLDDRLSKTTLLAFDADRDTDRLKAAGYTVQFVPFVALPGADGQPRDTAQAKGQGSGAWRELLAKLDAWQP